MIRLVVLGLVVNLILPVGTAARPAGAPLQGDPQAVAEVQAAFQKFLAARSWRARIKSPAGEEQTFAHVAPDRFHMVLKQGTQTSEMFMIGGEMWIRSSGGCQKLPVSIPILNPREAMEHSSDAKVTVAKNGPETIEGISTQTYTMIVETQGKQVRQKLYVATGSNLLRRIEIPSDRGTTSIDYFDYDAQITINNPPC